MNAVKIGSYTVDRDARTITVADDAPLFDDHSVRLALLEAADQISDLCREVLDLTASQTRARRELEAELTTARLHSVAHGTYELSAVDEHGAHLHTITVRF